MTSAATDDELPADADAGREADPGAESLFVTWLATWEARKPGAGPTSPEAARDFEQVTAAHPARALELNTLRGRYLYFDEARRAVGLGSFPRVSAFDTQDGERSGRILAGEPGRVLGDFRLITRLGEGAMGQVWEAEQLSLGGRRVALKLLRPGRLTEPMVERFTREARAGGRLNHAGVVGVYAQGETEGQLWIAMELVPGGFTLRDFLDDLQDSTELPPDYDRTVARLVAELAEALHVAHEAGVIHRDLKPQNVLLTPEGRIKLSDFGLARLLDEPAPSKSGLPVGTYYYMSPELVKARRRGVDHRTDIFSLGVVLYECLTLRRPFEGDTIHQVAHQIVEYEPTNPRRIRSQAPRDLAVLAGKCLEKDPARRCASMAALAADLRRFLAGEPILARPPSPPERAWKWARRHRALSAVLLLLPLLGVQGTLLWFAWGDAAAAREARTARRVEDLVHEGFHRLGEGEAKLSVDSFSQALELDAGNLEAVAGTCFALLRAKRNEQLATFLDMHPEAEAARPALRWLRELADPERAEAAREALLGSEELLHGDAFDLFLHSELLSAIPEDLGSEDLQRSVDLSRRAIQRSERARLIFFLGFLYRLQERLRHARPRTPDPEGRELAEALLALWPEDPYARFGAARGLLMAGDAPAARDLLTPLEEVLQDEPGYWDSLSVALKLVGDGDAAIAAAERHVALAPDSATAHFNLGVALADAGDPVGELEAYRRANSLDPNDFDTLFNLASRLHKSGEGREARSLLERACAIAPRNPQAHYQLGTGFMNCGLMHEAETAFRRTIDLDPEFAEAWCNLGLTLQYASDLDGAYQAFRRGHELGSQDPDWSYSSEHWARMARLAVESRYLLQPTLEQGELELGPWGATPEDRQQRGKDLFQLAHRHFGSHPVAAGRIAESLLQEPLGLDRAELLLLAGEAALRAGDLAHTRALLAEEFARDDCDLRVVQQHAIVSYLVGEHSTAREALERVLAAHPNMAAVHSSLARVEFSSGEFVRALESLERARGLASRELEEQLPWDRWLEHISTVADLADELRDDPDWALATRNVRELLGAAQALEGLGFHARAAERYQELFEQRPELLARWSGVDDSLYFSSDEDTGHLHEAACSAAAAVGEEPEGSAVRWSLQAGVWLRAEVEASLMARLDGRAGARDLLCRLGALLNDPRLEPVRNPASPAFLGAEFWDRVQALARARGAPRVE